MRRWRLVVAASLMVGFFGWSGRASGAESGLIVTVSAPSRAQLGTSFGFSATIANLTGGPVGTLTLTVNLFPAAPALLLSPADCSQDLRSWDCPLPNQNLAAGGTTTIDFTAVTDPQGPAGPAGVFVDVTGEGINTIRAEGEAVVNLLPAPPPSYTLVAADGGVFPFGAPFWGSLGNVRLAAPIVAAASTSDGEGYYLLGADGGVFPFGDAPFLGSAVDRITSPAVGIAVSDVGQYEITTADGTVWRFEAHKAPKVVYAPKVHLNAPIVGVSAAPGSGEWLVAADGGVFPLPGSPFLGSLGGERLAHPIVAIDAVPFAGGYRLIDSAGRTFSFGNIDTGLGDTHNLALVKPVVAMTDSRTGGYWSATADGGVFAFGAPFRGSLGNLRINKPVVAIVANDPFTRSIYCDISFCTFD